VTLTFNALPGRIYGLDKSQCSATLEGRRQTCRAEIVEIETPAEGG